MRSAAAITRDENPDPASMIRRGLSFLISACVAAAQP
jgi:hypothetical protein